MKKLKEIIEKSLYLGSKPSSSRIQSYIMMVVIFLLGITHVVFEIGNAFIQWGKSEVYSPSAESIIIIGMWLAHQLTLLGIYKRSERMSNNTQSIETGEESTQTSSEDTEA
jgi:predicted ferric reductase